MDLTNLILVLLKVLDSQIHHKDLIWDLLDMDPAICIHFLKIKMVKVHFKISHPIIICQVWEWEDQEWEALEWVAQDLDKVCTMDHLKMEMSFINKWENINNKESNN